MSANRFCERPLLFVSMLMLSTSAGGCIAIPIPGIPSLSKLLSDSSTSGAPAASTDTANCGCEQKWSSAPEVRRKQSVELVSQAASSYRSGNLPVARNLLRRARQVDPACNMGYELEARIALDMQNRNEAIVMLQAAAATHPQSAEVQNRAGNLLVQQGAVGPGLSALEQAIALEPANARYTCDLAAAFVGINNKPAAEAVLAAGLKRNLRDPSLPRALARLCESQGNWKSAADYYTVVLGNEPNNLAWRTQRARCLYRAEEFAPAAADFAVCQSHLQQMQAWSALLEFGECCLRTGDETRAEKVLAEVARYCPDKGPQIAAMRIEFAGPPSIRDFVADTGKPTVVIRPASAEVTINSQTQLAAIRITPATPVAKAETIASTKSKVFAMPGGLSTPDEVVTPAAPLVLSAPPAPAMPIAPAMPNLPNRTVDAEKAPKTAWHVASG